MIKDLFVSFTENLKQKTSNPFLGSLIIVWIFHNWDLVFTFFNFDKELKLKDKVEILTPYFKFWTFLGNLGECVILTIFVIVISYTLMNVSLYIVDVFNKRLKPWILSLNDENSIVPMEELKAINFELKDLRKKYDDEVSERIKYQDRYRELKDKEIENSMVLGPPATNKTDEKEEKKENESEMIFNILKNEGIIEAVVNTIPDILLNKGIPDSKAVQTMLNYNLVKLKSSSSSGYYVSLTQKGTLFKDYINKVANDYKYKNPQKNVEQILIDLNSIFNKSEFDEIITYIKNNNPIDHSKLRLYLENNRVIEPTIRNARNLEQRQKYKLTSKGHLVVAKSHFS